MKSFARVFLVSYLAVSSTNLAGQEQPPAPTAALPTQRVGVTGPPLSLTLREAIGLALQNNQDIEIERANLQATSGLLLSVEGAFDPLLQSGPAYVSERLPVASVLAGGPSGTLSQTNLGWNTGVTQLLPWGGSYQVAFDNFRSTTSNIFTQLNPQFSTGLTFTFTQPLLRNFAVDEPRRQLRLRRRDVQISEAQFRQTVMDVMVTVQQAFWDLGFARQQADVFREAMELAREQREITRRQVDAGVIAPIEITAAEAEFQRRQEEYLAGVEQVTQAENALKQLLAESRLAPLWDREVVPAEADPLQASLPSLDEAVQQALRNRPELERLVVQLAQNEIDLDFFRSQLRPQLDLVASYGRSGLAGTVRPSTGSPFPQQPPPAFFSGGYDQALGMLFDRDFRTAQVGLVFSFPIRNRTAEGNLARSQANERSLRAARAQLEQAISAQVRNSMQSVVTAQQRLEAARSARVASRENLESEMRRFRAGETTNFLVLTRQNEYSAARAAEVRAVSDLNKAIANFQRTTGTTLEAYGVQIETVR